MSVPPRAARARRAERWVADSGSRDVVRLEIPADASRERRFEICCRLLVHNRPGRPGATHAMRVLVDGALEWSRRAETQPGDDDALELRLHRVVAAGRPLRVTADGELRHAVRISLSIVAEEEDDPGDPG